MKSILKILVLGAVPILAVTMAADPALAADGSQLIFQTNMDVRNYISTVNTSTNQAVTVLVQYYNDEMERAVWYLRVIPAGTNILVDPFNHSIPGADANIGDAIMASGKAGDGNFVIAVTAVGAVTVDDTETADNEDPVAGGRVNILFPGFLADDMDGTDNIDACGTLVTQAQNDTAADRDSYTHQEDDVEDNRCEDDDDSSKNVGGLTVDNAQPIVFNHLTGHFTQALTSTPIGGADQTASWGGAPVIRAAVQDTNNTVGDQVRDYQILTGANTSAADEAGGRLAEVDAGGAEVNVHGATGHTVSGFLNVGDNFETDTTEDLTGTTNGGKIRNGDRDIRGLNGGSLELPALHGGGAETQQIMLLLSVTDDFGGAGGYELRPAMTGYTVNPIDQMGNGLDKAGAADPPVFGSGAAADDTPDPSAAIIVNGINVMTNANLGECTGTAIDGSWTLNHLTSLVPEAAAGGKDFAGLDATIDPMVNASPGWVRFERAPLTCKKDYGDGDSENLSAIENPDGIPVEDERTYTAGTLHLEETSQNRAFVTSGRAVLVFVTQTSTFGASWSLTSPSSPAGEDGDVSN